jgi:hypothetical protein
MQRPEINMNSSEDLHPKLGFLEIRSLIESGNFTEAIREIEDQFISGLKSYPLIGLLFIESRKRNAESVAQETLSRFRSFIDGYFTNEIFSQPQQDIWISNILIKEIYLQEGRFVNTKQTPEWALNYVRESDLKISERQNFFLSLDRNWDQARLKYTWHFYFILALKSRQNGNSADASEYFLKSFELTNDQSFPIEEFLEFMIINFGDTLNSDGSPVNVVRAKIFSFTSEHNSKNVEDLLSHFLTDYRSKEFEVCFKASSETLKMNPEHGIFKELDILSAEHYESFTPNRKNILFYAPGRIGKYVYFAESYQKKSGVRESPFSRNEVLSKDSTRIIQVQIEDLMHFEPRKIARRLIVNPGRVGSTLLHRMLRSAGAESVSETWGDWMLPDLAWRGVISKEVAIHLSQIETHLLFDDEESLPSHVIKKLPGVSSIYVDALLGADDDAVFLLRDLQGYFSSRRRIGATPARASDALINTLIAIQQVEQRGKLAGIVWYGDLVSTDLGKLNSLFTGYVERPISAYDMDSQLGTHLSRENLAKSSPRYELEEFWRSWMESEGPALAKKLKLEPLIESEYKFLNFKSTSKRGKTLRVVPGNRWGSVTHYYHFLLGFFLPFVCEEINNSIICKFSFPDSRSMNRHLLFLNDVGFNVEIHDEGSRQSELEQRTYIGWDHESLYEYAQIEKVVDFLRSKLKLAKFEDKTNRKIVIVDRSVTNREEGDFDTYGIDRRSTPNLFKLGERLGDNWEISYVRLEGASLLDQIELFGRADIVVAQHGAALANLVWCQPKTRVFEISDSQVRSPAFEKLSKRMKLIYTKVQQSTSHAEIDIEHLANLIESGTLP